MDGSASLRPGPLVTAAVVLAAAALVQIVLLLVTP
jgi:hypothetical protein